MYCKYPECRKRASKSWALVPLCGKHHEDIRKETAKYYARKSTSHGMREKYSKIAHLIPWSQKV